MTRDATSPSSAPASPGRCSRSSRGALGRSVVLLERGTPPALRHRRVVTPRSRTCCSRSSRDRTTCRGSCRSAAWGPGSATYPTSRCGLKRGFTFFRHERGRAVRRATPTARDQLLVAASPHDEVGDTHWYRPDFDHFLAGEAVAAGAQYLDARRSPSSRSGAEGATLAGASGRSRAAPFARGSSWTRPARRLPASRPLPAPPRGSATSRRPQALFTHFAGVRRLDG